jgi:hypothetical protein
MKIIKNSVLTLLFVFIAATVQAQTGACPTSTAVAVNPGGWVCVTPASDHATMHPTPPITGVPQVPVVVRYDLLLFGPSVTDTATGAPTQTIDIGKPTINAQGALWVQRTEISSLPLNQQYRARVVAVGQPLTAGGPAQVSPRSPESNPFLRLGPAPAPSAPTRVSVPE